MTIKVSSLTDEQRSTKRKNGISAKVFYLRVNRQGLSIDDAITKKVRKKRTNKNFTKEELEDMNRKGITDYAALKRIKNGWNREKAMTIIPNKKMRYIAYKNDEEVASGKDYEVANKLGIRLETMLNYTRPAHKARYKNPTIEIDKYSLKEWEEMHEC